MDPSSTPLERPRPICKLLQVQAILKGIVLYPDPLIDQLLPRPSALVPQNLRHVVERQNGQREAICLIPDSELQRRVYVSLLFVTSNVHPLLTWAVVRQSVHEPGIGVEGKDDRSVQACQWYAYPIRDRTPCIPHKKTAVH